MLLILVSIVIGLAMFFSVIWLYRKFINYGIEKKE